MHFISLHCFFPPNSLINSNEKRNPGAFQAREPPFGTDNMSAWERGDSSSGKEKVNSIMLKSYRKYFTRKSAQILFILPFVVLYCDPTFYGKVRRVVSDALLLHSSFRCYSVWLCFVGSAGQHCSLQPGGEIAVAQTISKSWDQQIPEDVSSHVHQMALLSCGWLVTPNWKIPRNSFEQNRIDLWPRDPRVSGHIRHSEVF